MKKIVLLWLLPVFLASKVIDSTELPLELSEEEKYQLQYKEYSSDFKRIPDNPTVFQETAVYQDSDLTEVSTRIKPNQKITITDIVVNQRGELVFELSHKHYIKADTSLLYDDHILSQKSVKETVWLKKGFQMWTSPITNRAKLVSTDLKAYQAVQITERVETPVASFAQVNGKGWVATEYISEVDNRMEAVQTLLDTKYQSENLSIYVKQLSTNYVAGVNQNRMMYAASITKLPILYYAQEQLDHQQVSLTDSLHYTKETEEFDGAFDPAGSGSLPKIPDNQTYRVDDLLNRIAKESDNVASNLIGYHVDKQMDKDFYKEITDIVGQRWDMVSRESSAEMAGLMMEALYQQNGYVLEAMKETQFDQQRIARDIPVAVAHKIGDAYDFKHDVAVVYADSPFILSIFTNQSTYEDISQIANDVYGILK